MPCRRCTQKEVVGTVFAVDPHCSTIIAVHCIKYKTLKTLKITHKKSCIWFTVPIFRMRAKTSDFLKVLNRAKIEDESAKKKISHQWGNKS